MHLFFHFCLNLAAQENNGMVIQRENGCLIVNSNKTKWQRNFGNIFLVMKEHTGLHDMGS